MKIILIGNQGQVGREVQELAQNKGHSVAGFDLFDLDIINAGQVSAVFAQHSNADIVLNAAAYTAVDKAEDEPDKAMLINGTSVKNITDAIINYRKPSVYMDCFGSIGVSKRIIKCIGDNLNEGITN